MIVTQTFTAGAPGDKTLVLLPFLPTALKFKVLKPGYPDSSIQFLGGGWTNGTAGEGVSIIDNGTVQTYVDPSKCLLAYDVVGGVSTKVIEATFVSFIAPNRVKLNFTVASAAYQIQVEMLS